MKKIKQKRKLARKNKIKNNIIIKIVVLLFSIFLILNGQYEKDIKKDAPPLSKEYTRISSFESLSTWAVASLNKETYISKVFADSKNNIHFVYYDNILKAPVYVSGKDGKFNREIIDKDREFGDLVSMATNSENMHISYMKNNKVWYANNNSGYFNNYPMELKENQKIIDLKLVVSTFNSPALFFVDNKGILYVSRFYRDNFFSDLIYTNKTIDAVYPVAEKDGYAIYIKEYQTDNIFYASRKTNSKFKFFDNNPIVENAYLYSVNHEEHNRFSVIYIPKDNENSIDYKKFYEGNFTEGNIITENENIISLDSTLDYSAKDIIFYTKENGYKYVYIDEHTIDLSSLGKSKGDIRIASAQYPYFYMVYYNDLFKELRISKLNVSHINIKRY